MALVNLEAPLAPKASPQVRIGQHDHFIAAERSFEPSGQESRSDELPCIVFYLIQKKIGSNMTANSQES